MTENSDNLFVAQFNVKNTFEYLCIVVALCIKFLHSTYILLTILVLCNKKYKNQNDFCISFFIVAI